MFSDEGGRGPTRRAALLGAAALLAAGLGGCANPVGSTGAATIDARADRTLSYLLDTWPEARGLLGTSAGVLVMPLMTEAGLGLGGAYGQGALRIGGATVDYYSAAEGSVGLQAGAQQYAHVLFFMTADALREFRASPGWAAGAELEYALSSQGGSLGADTITSTSPVITAVFGQSGLIAGASVAGIKYTRIIP